MGVRIGSLYLGSPNIQTSVANEEIVPVKPANWTMGYSFYKFDFLNKSSCHIIVNNGDPIYLEANNGFSTTEVDAIISSFKVVESGILFQWVGGV